MPPAPLPKTMTITGVVTTPLYADDQEISNEIESAVTESLSAARAQAVPLLGHRVSVSCLSTSVTRLPELPVAAGEMQELRLLVILTVQAERA